jgi:hypothetical protein
MKEMFNRLKDAAIQFVGFDGRVAQDQVPGKPYSPGFDLLKE